MDIQLDVGRLAMGTRKNGLASVTIGGPAVSEEDVTGVLAHCYPLARPDQTRTFIVACL